MSDHPPARTVRTRTDRAKRHVEGTTRDHGGEVSTFEVEPWGDVRAVVHTRSRGAAVAIAGRMLDVLSYPLIEVVETDDLARSAREDGWTHAVLIRGR